MSTLMSELRTTTMRFSPLFFFNDTATTEIYTLSLHDALPISPFPQNFRRRQDRAALPLAVRLLLSRSPLCAREVSSISAYEDQPCPLFPAPSENGPAQWR